MDIKFVIKNGDLIDKDNATVSIYNKALFFDFAVYSNIKVVQGRMLLPDLEVEKLFESAKAIGIVHDFKKENIMQWAKQLITANSINDALIRLLLIGQEKENEPLLFLFPVPLTFYPGKFYTDGIKLITYQGERQFPTSKSKDLLLCYVAYREALKQDAIDSLLIDKHQNILEGTRSSFFAVKNNTLIIPQKSKVLEGVTRKIIIDIASKTMKIEEKDISINSIKDYDELFITGTTLNIMPVRQINNTVLKKTGSKVKELQNLFKRYIKNEPAGIH